MEINDVLRAAEDVIRGRYPEDPVYWDRLPKNFRRPSFTLELQALEAADMNRFLQRLTATVLVTCYVKADDYSDSSREALNARLDGVTALFAPGFLRVGKRAVTVNAMKGIGSPLASEVTIVFSWTDQRPAVSPGPAAPSAEHYSLRVQAKTNSER